MQQKILVVDDDAGVRDTLSNILCNDGFDVVAAADGASALIKAQAELPSLIILDLMMPHMSGLELCKALKSDATTRDIPVIMLTAKAADGDKIIGFKLGADDYVTKPFNPRELILRIHRSLSF